VLPEPPPQALNKAMLKADSARRIMFLMAGSFLLEKFGGVKLQAWGLG
jgi:hypothetical protein